MKYPFISCKMLTYSRVNFLEEALFSFLHQDYPEEMCELIIVNDYPLQTLVFDHPQVKIFNLTETFPFIGEKENFATEQCKGDIVVQFDDDEISLPSHFQNISKYFVEGTSLLHWDNAMFMNVPKIEALTGVGNSGIVYSKQTWEDVGRYPLENCGHDRTFVNKIRDAGKKIVYAHPPDEEVSWAYCWGGRAYHLSGLGDDTPDRPNIIQRHSAYIESERLKGNVPIGIIELKPHWVHPYDKLLKDFIQNKKDGNK